MALSGAGCGSPVMAMRSPPRSFSEAFSRLAVDQHIALVDEQLHARAAHALELRGQKMVEPLAACFLRHFDGAQFSSCCRLVIFRLLACGFALQQHQCSGNHQQHSGHLRPIERSGSAPISIAPRPSGSRQSSVM